MDFTDRLLRHDVDGLCTLTLNRPDKLNALDERMFEAIDAVAADLEAQTETVGCVVLKGAGRAFCAGVDLGSLGARTLPPGYSGQVIERLGRLPQPLIAAIHGVCYTGALELALTCDLIVADPTTRFADTHGKWGLVAGSGMSERLPRRIGMARAQGMTFTARTVGAEEAAAIGLIDVLAPEGGLDGAVAELAAAILANSWFSNIAHKRIMRETAGLPIDAALARGRELAPGRAPDSQERIARFSRK